MKWCRDYQFTEALNRIWFSSDVRARAIAAVQRGFEARSMLCVCTNQNRFRRRNNINPILKVSLLNLFPFFFLPCVDLSLSLSRAPSLSVAVTCAAHLFIFVWNFGCCGFIFIGKFFYLSKFVAIWLLPRCTSVGNAMCRLCSLLWVPVLWFFF